MVTMPPELYFAPLVIAQRMPLLWLEAVGLSRTPQRESQRMVTEKMAAVFEGSVAVQVELQRIWWQSSLAVMRGMAPPGPMSASRRVTAAALAPAARRVKSNMRRLARS
jgi:hypothetical protein